MPIGISYLVEISAFTVVALLLAQLGATVVAAHQITLNFSAIVYMVPQTISVALTVRVGQAVGAGNEASAAYTCKIGLQLALAFACCTAVAIWFGAPWLAGLYSSDPQVVTMAGSLLLFAAVYQLPDAGTGVLGRCVARLQDHQPADADPGAGILGRGGAARLPACLHGVPWLNAGQPLAAAGFWGALVLSLFLVAVRCCCTCAMASAYPKPDRHRIIGFSPASSVMLQSNVSLQPYNTFGIAASIVIRRNRFARHAARGAGRSGGAGSAVAGARRRQQSAFTRDFDGLVLQMRLSGKRCYPDDGDSVLVQAMAGENWHSFVMWTLQQDWQGLENMALIPGTVGAAPIQNIGAWRPLPRSKRWICTVANW